MNFEYIIGISYYDSHYEAKKIGMCQDPLTLTVTARSSKNVEYFRAITYKRLILFFALYGVACIVLYCN